MPPRISPSHAVFQICLLISSCFISSHFVSSSLLALHQIISHVLSCISNSSHRLVSPSPVSSNLTQPCPASSWQALLLRHHLFYLLLSHVALSSYVTKACPSRFVWLVSSFVFLPCHVLKFDVLTCHILPCHISSHLIISHLISSRLNS